MKNIREYEGAQEALAMLQLLTITEQRSKSAKGIKQTFVSLRNKVKSSLYNKNINSVTDGSVIFSVNQTGNRLYLILQILVPNSSLFYRLKLD